MAQVMEELKETIGQIRKKVEGMETSQATEGERLEALEKMADDLKAKMEAMPKVPVDRAEVIERDGQWVMRDDQQAPYMKAILTGKARGHRTSDLWQMKSDDPELKEWQKAGDDLHIFTQGYAIANGISFMESWRKVSAQSRLAKAWAAQTDVLRKALDTAESGGGAEFVPTEFSRDLIERITSGLRVAALHRRIMIPRSPFELPAMGVALNKGFKVAESTGANFLTEANKISELTIKTRKVTWAAQGVGGLAIFSGELDDDSIVPMAEFVRNDIVSQIQNAQENAILNGSEEATHPDNDIETDGSSSVLSDRLWDGYRQMATRPSTNTTLDMAGVVTIGKHRELRSKMSRYGAQPGDLALVGSVKVILLHIMNMPEVTTLDKMGPNATILNGQIASLDGSPVIMSDFGRDNVSSTGFNTSGGPNTKTTYEIVNRRAMWFGDVRGMRVDQFRSIWTDQVVLVGKLRTDFEDVQPSTEPIVGMAINI